MDGYIRAKDFWMSDPNHYYSLCLVSLSQGGKSRTPAQADAANRQ